MGGETGDGLEMPYSPDNRETFFVSGYKKLHLESPGCLCVVPVAVINALAWWRLDTREELRDLSVAQICAQGWIKDHSSNQCRKAVVVSDRYPDQPEAIYKST